MSSFDTWFTPRPAARARLRLICFPFAGGGASIFRTWSEELPHDVEIWPANLPGREGRLRETPFERISPLVRAIADVLVPKLTGPFALYGHSMGARIAFELGRELRRRQAPAPLHLFVSGRRAPHLPHLDAPVHTLSNPQLIVKLRAFGGTPEVVLQDPDLLEMFLPIIRADFGVNEAEPFVREEPLPYPISAFGGLQDDRAPEPDVAAWSEHTSSTFVKTMFPGDHFFVTKARGGMLRAIAQTLSTT